MAVSYKISPQHNTDTMNLIEHATHVQNQLDQAITRIETLSAEHAAVIAAKDTEHASAVAALVAEHANAIANKEFEHASAISANKSELASVKGQFAGLDAYRLSMETKVADVLKTGDIAQYEALANEFLAPTQERERQAKLAKIALLRNEALELEADIVK